MLANIVGRIKDRAILDVGTGTGRAALLLARGGAQRHRRRRVGGDAGDRAAARRRTSSRQRHVPAAATRTRSSFADRAFDVVVSLRVLMHTPRVAAAASPSCAASPIGW